MDVRIGSRWADVIAELVATGRFASAEDVVSEGLALVAERERRFHELKELINEAYGEEGSETIDEVRAAVDAALDAAKADAV